MLLLIKLWSLKCKEIMNNSNSSLKGNAVSCLIKDCVIKQ